MVRMLVKQRTNDWFVSVNGYESILDSPLVFYPFILSSTCLLLSFSHFSRLFLWFLIYHFCLYFVEFLQFFSSTFHLTSPYYSCLKAGWLWVRVCVCVCQSSKSVAFFSYVPLLGIRLYRFGAYTFISSTT